MTYAPPSYPEGTKMKKCEACDGTGARSEGSDEDCNNCGGYGEVPDTDPGNLFKDSESAEGRGAKREREQVTRWLRSTWAWMAVQGQPEEMPREYREKLARRFEAGEHWKA